MQRHHEGVITVQDFSDFRTSVSEAFVPLHVSSNDPDRFQGRIRSVEVDDVHVYDVVASPHMVERTPELLARTDRQFYKVGMLLSGTGLLIQDDREAVLQPGMLTIYDTSRPYTLTFDDQFRNLVVMFPKHLLDLPGPLVSQLTAVPISGTSGVGAMVAPYLAHMAGNLGELTGSTGVRLAHVALDLVATLLSRELDLDSAHRVPHHALLQRIRSYIDANLGATDLGPNRIAAAHYISTRQLHSIFRQQDTTVSTWIRQRRLERCRRDLLDPLFDDLPVAGIAARRGFIDAAHFSRVFKATFGTSPSELRIGRRA
jgi:AraC-like DNA-binding protein